MKIKALRNERYNAEDVDDAAKVATALGTSQRAVQTLQRQNPLPTYLYDVACGTAGAVIRIRHNLGRSAKWEVIDWKRTTPGGTHGLERVSDDRTTLTLASYVAGTASLKVY